MPAEQYVTRNFGHPWTREPGWDLLEVKCQTETDLDAFIAAAEKKFWQIWIRDNTGQIQAALYKPSGITKIWDDKPN